MGETQFSLKGGASLNAEPRGESNKCLFLATIFLSFETFRFRVMHYSNTNGESTVKIMTYEADSDLIYNR